MLFWLLPDKAVYWWQDKIDGPKRSTIMPVLLLAEIELVWWTVVFVVAMANWGPR